MKMPFKRFIQLIDKVLKKESEERIWQMWLARYPNMTENTYISFEDFRNKAMTPKKNKNNQQSTEELIEMAEKVKQADLKASA